MLASTAQSDASVKSPDSNAGSADDQTLTDDDDVADAKAVSGEDETLNDAQSGKDRSADANADDTVDDETCAKNAASDENAASDDETLNTEATNAVERRALDWVEYRLARDQEYQSEYAAMVKTQKQFLKTDNLFMVFLPVNELRSLIADYAVDPADMYVARKYLTELLTDDLVITGLPEQDLMSVAKQILEFDPVDGQYGDPQFRDSEWFLSKDRRMQRFNPVIEKCEGCGTCVWTHLRHHKRGGGSYYDRLELERRDIAWLESQNLFGFVCEACKESCYCNNRRMTFYQRYCSVCGDARCNKHAFPHPDPLNQASWAYTMKSKDQCSACLRLLDLGRALSGILQDPQPHAALDRLIDSQPKS